MGAASGCSDAQMCGSGDAFLASNDMDLRFQRAAQQFQIFGDLTVLLA